MKARYFLTTALAATLSCVAVSAHAQQAAQPGADEESAAETIIVTGTRGSNRTASESSAPIDVFGSDDLLESGDLELGQALQRLAPSFNLPRTSIGTTGAIRAATLRGLAPDQTLVLVNGKRRHQTSIINTNNTVGRGSVATDLSLIPMAAIKRIEVLRDGASAQYGSDAIAGVINIILDDDDDGARLSLRSYKTERAEGLGGQMSLSAGVPLGDGGSLRLTAELAANDRTNTATANFNGTRQTNPNYGKVTSWFGDNKAESALVSANLNLPLGGDVELYGHATGGWRDVTGPGFFRDRTGAGGVFSGVDNGLVHPSGYLPLGQTEQTDFEIYTGLRGTLGGGWRWNLSTGFGQNVIDLALDNAANASLGAASPTEFDLGGFKYWQWKTELELARTFDVLAGADITFGASHRRENYSIRPGDAASRFEAGSDPSRGLDPATPIDEGRTSYALFVDGELNVTDQFRLGAAGRYEHYSSFGNTLTGKLSGYFEATDWLSLRGSISSGFRAPSLQQVFYTTINRRTDPVTASILTVGTFPVDGPAARAVGALPLEPEKSRQLSAGIALKPARGLLLTIDYFNTRIKDRITLSEQLTGTAVRNALIAAGINNVTAISFFTNALDTTTEGIEIAASYQKNDIFGGDLALTAAFTHYKTEIDRVRSNTVVPALPLLGARSLSLLTLSQPQTKASFDTSFTKGPVTVSAIAAYYGDYMISFGDQIPIGDEVVIDLNVGVQLTKGIRLGAGIQNLLDEYPDIVADKAATQGARIRSLGWRYPEDSPFGNNGRTYTFSLTAEF